MPSDPLQRAIVALNSQLELSVVLDTFLAAAAEQTGARYAAINIVDDDGLSVEFHYTGMPSGVWAAIGRAPNHVATLAQIPADGMLIIDELSNHPHFKGFPPGHPPMGAFLGTALRVRSRVFGYLYLADKREGFSEDDVAVVAALAAAASVAIDNAQLYERAILRERWVEASQQITTALLSDRDDDEALGHIVHAAVELADASHGALVLPGVGDTWVMEFTAGPRAADLLGLVLLEEGFALGTLRSGNGAIAPEPPGGAVLAPVQDFGPTLYAPLRAAEGVVGMLMVWRNRGTRVFEADDLAIAQRFADQAAVALTLSEFAHIRNLSQLLEERARLADDLHDFVSQELFATAMEVEAIAEQAPPHIADRLASTLDHVKRAQHEVRGVMRALAGQRASEPFAERFNRELVMARDSLGFNPSLKADWKHVAATLAADYSLADDAIAVARELFSNVARHAHATAVEVELRATEGRFSITITDNGIGPAGASNRHSGTSNLAGRAIRRNGTFTLEEVTPGADKPGTRAEWNVQAGAAQA